LNVAFGEVPEQQVNCDLSTESRPASSNLTIFRSHAGESVVSKAARENDESYGVISDTVPQEGLAAGQSLPNEPQPASYEEVVSGCLAQTKLGASIDPSSELVVVTGLQKVASGPRQSAPSLATECMLPRCQLAAAWQILGFGLPLERT
jgi:hypothetical protein